MPVERLCDRKGLALAQPFLEFRPFAIMQAMRAFRWGQAEFCGKRVAAMAGVDGRLRGLVTCEGLREGSFACLRLFGLLAHAEAPASKKSAALDGHDIVLVLIVILEEAFHQAGDEAQQSNSARSFAVMGSPYAAAVFGGNPAM